LSSIPQYVQDPDRLVDLDEYSILDTLPEPGFEDIVKLMMLICETPGRPCQPRRQRSAMVQGAGWFCPAKPIWIGPSARMRCWNLNEEKVAKTKLNTVALRKGVNAKTSTAA
jgi:hypothetical protein